MSEEAEPKQGEERRVRPWRRVLYVSWRSAILICAIPLVVMLIVPFLLIGQEITAPSWIRSQVEAQAATVLGGGDIRFGEITVEIGRDLHPRVRMRDVVVRDARAVELARVGSVEALVSPRGLILNQEVLVQRVVLRGSEVGLRRSTDGTLELAFERQEAQARDLAAVLDAVDGVLALPGLAAFEGAQIEGLILNYADARAGQSWVVDDGRAALEVSGEAVRVSAQLALLSGRSYVTTLEVGYESPRGSRAAEISVSVRDVAAEDIATQSAALTWMSGLRGQVSAQMRGSVDADGALGPLFATLEIGAGVLQPDVAAEPIGFEAVKAYLQYDPAAGRIAFEQVEVRSDFGALRAEGQAYLREIEGGLPGALVGQFRVIDLEVAPGDLYPVPLLAREVTAQVRLRLDPFVADIGYLGGVLGTQGVRFEAQGRVAATAQGWDVALSAHVPQVGPEPLQELWPAPLAPGTRAWFSRNFMEGEIVNLRAGIGRRPGEAVTWALTHGFEAATVRVLRDWPPAERAAGTVAIQEGTLTVLIEEGVLPAPLGGDLALAGSVFHIPDLRQRPTRGEIDVVASGSVTSVLALLDLPPFGFMGRADLPVDLAQGAAEVRGQVRLPLMRDAPRAEISFEFAANLRGVETSRLVPGRVLRAAAVSVAVDGDGVQISGPVRVGDVRADMEWAQVFGQPGSRVVADVALGEAFLREFNIALPPGMVGGDGRGVLTVDLARGRPPAFELRSDLAGMVLRLPALGWSKGAGVRGVLEVAGTLGAVPRVDRLVLRAGDLVAEGDVRLREGGGLDRARFSTLRLGGWLETAVTIVGRGVGRPVGIELAGGSLDLRRANFGPGGGDGGPMQVALDRLQVSEGIVFRDFRGEFDGRGGLSGAFTARLGGTAPVSGVLAPVEGRTGVRLRSDDAGAVLAAAGLLETAVGGAMDLTLRPTGGAGVYDGTLAVTDLRVREAPALAALLDAVSVVGLLQQLDGQGLSFTNVDAQFRLTPTQIIVAQSSAVGPGLGISVDGIYAIAGKVMDFQGVVSPIYILNGIGSFLTRPGEGLFGFNFTLSGPAENVQVGVNPLSVLTPGMFREIFRRPVPVLE